MKAIRFIRWASTASIVAFAAACGAAEPAGFDAQVDPFFQTYCRRCHAETKQDGEFRLDTLSRDFTDLTVAQRWAEVLFRINSGEMPPKGERQPSPAELGRVADWLSGRIKEGEAARLARRGPVAHYRLSRDEYAYTVFDLLGVHYDVRLPGAFNEDPRWHGFERIGALLTLSPSHVDRYFKAAEAVLERAFPEQPPQPVKVRRDANEGREKWLADRGLTGRVRWPLWPASRRHLMNVSAPGVYRIRIQLSGLSPAEGRTPHLTLWHQQLKRSVFDHDVLAPEDKPTVLEFELPLSPGGFEIVNETPPAFSDVGNHTLNVLNGGGSVFTHSREARHLNPTGYKLFDDDGRALYPMLLVDWIEWEGPLTSEADLRKREGLVPPADAGPEAVRAALKKLAERAWRRPVDDRELDRYLQVVAREQAAGENPRSAYRAAMVGVLTSKNFYYLEEGSAGAPRDRVDDFELASRLSYFLWSSCPDDELAAAARAGRLREPTTLRDQLIRMLNDPKIERFQAEFPRQWLQLHRVGMFPPDSKLYPDYDKWLEQCIVLETEKYFGEVFQKNLPIRELLASDWTLVNPRLALHYGLPRPTGAGFERVALRPEDRRGGLLTQASVLSLTSDGVRHRPVHRGVWVSEAIFGRTPPPPPPNVEPLAPVPNDRPKATVRMQLEAHATHATCASCHQKIDPLGFAFENYDAIGRWRTEEQATSGQGANPPVDASGVLPDGRPFRDVEQFKRLLADDVDRFAVALVEQLATFGLRRVMTIDDAPHLAAVAASAKADGYPLRTLVERLVLSELFQKR